MSTNTNSAEQHQQQQQQQQQDPSSLHLQETSGGGGGGGSGVTSESVLPSLMEVYNTMIQSKTPEGGPRTMTTTTTTNANTTSPASSSHATAFPFFGGFSGDVYSTTAASAAVGPGGANPTLHNQHTPANVAEWNTYTMTGKGKTSLPSIPPILPNTFGGAESIGRKTRQGDSRTSITNPTLASGAGSTGRSMRKRSSDNVSPPGSVSSGRSAPKARKKASDTDGRWSKRFSWPEELHRDFVSAIFDVGLKHSSPSSILEHMPKHEQITSERVKSHLQKYRLHRIKSKKEFMSSYDAGLDKMKSFGAAEMPSSSNFSGGEMASFLTHTSVHDGDTQMVAPGDHQESSSGAQSALAAEDVAKMQTATHNNPTNIPAIPLASTQAKAPDEEILTLPCLTEDEKQSPIGTSMGYLIGLFFSLKQQLLAQRAAAAAAAAAASAAAVATTTTQAVANETKSETIATTPSDTPAAAVYNSFVAGPGSGGGGAISADAIPIRGAEAPATVVSNPSTRSNLEENNMMKREMQNQMAFQNKMRGLKQQELNKFSNADSSASTLVPGQGMVSTATANSSATLAEEDLLSPASVTHTEDHHMGEPHPQGAGETASGTYADGRQTRGFSLGGVEDFWNTDVVDDQLFEFLMLEQQ